MIPIPKAGDSRCIENYKGITLLSTVGKAFMTILNSRLAKWLEAWSILVNEQAGFREGYSTVDQVFILNELICRQKRRKRKWVCAFLDIKRAYDVVWRDAMWKALWDVGVRGRMWRMLQGVYKGVQSCVDAGGVKSDWEPSTIGVRQGCIISPTLFCSLH